MHSSESMNDMQKKHDIRVQRSRNLCVHGRQHIGLEGATKPGATILKTSGATNPQANATSHGIQGVGWLQTLHEDHLDSTGSNQEITDQLRERKKSGKHK